MTGYQSKQRRSISVLSLSVGLLSLLAVPLFSRSAQAEEGIARSAQSEDIAAAPDQQPLEWARIIFLRNRAQLLREDEDAQRANVSDILRVGDALRTLRRARADLRFNDDSLARIGSRATFQFTPNTRNFQLTNGTVLLLIPPARGRTTIQTPNAVTGIQGSALFVRYIPETDTTIVGALTDNPKGPMVLYNEDGSEQQELRANEIGVIEGDRIVELYQFDSELFWESSALAEGFDYTQNSPTGDDALDAVRIEIRDAVEKNSLPENGGDIIENPESFSSPSIESDGETDDAGSETQTEDDPVEEEPAEDSTDSETPVDEPAKDPPKEESIQEEPSSRTPVQDETNGSGTGSGSQDAAGQESVSNNTAAVTASESSAQQTTDDANADEPVMVERAALTSAPTSTEQPALEQAAQEPSSTNQDAQAEAPLIVEEENTAGGAQPGASDLIVPAVELQNQPPLESVESADEIPESADEPVSVLPYEGTPAERYHSIPQAQIQNDVVNNNSLVPAGEVPSENRANSSNQTNSSNQPSSSDEEEVIDEEPQDVLLTEDEAPVLENDPIEVAAPQTEELPTDIEEQSAGVDLDPAVIDAIVIPPASLKDPADGEEDVDEEGVDEEGVDEVEDTAVEEEPIVDEEPVIEEPVGEEPAVEEEPIVDEELVIEEPVGDEPIVDEELVIEEPVGDEPIVDEELAIDEEPIVDEELVIEEPVGEEPAVEEPVVEEVPIEEPAVEEPVVEEVPIEEPAVEEPVVEEVLIEEPIVEEPVVEEVLIEDPIVGEPVVEEVPIEDPIVEESIIEDVPIVDLVIEEQPMVEEQQPFVGEVVIEESIVEEVLEPIDNIDEVLEAENSESEQTLDTQLMEEAPMESVEEQQELL